MTCLGGEGWRFDDHGSALGLNLVGRFAGEPDGDRSCPPLAAVIVTDEAPWTFQPALAGTLPATARIHIPPHLSPAARTTLRASGRQIVDWTIGMPVAVGTMTATVVGPQGACVIQAGESAPAFYWAAGAPTAERERRSRRWPGARGIACVAESGFRHRCACPPWPTEAHAACIAEALLDWYRWRAMQGQAPRMTLLARAPRMADGALDVAGRVCRALTTLTGATFEVPAPGDAWCFDDDDELRSLHRSGAAGDAAANGPGAAPLSDTALRELGPLSSGRISETQLAALFDELARRLYGSPQFAQLYSLTPEETGDRRPTLALALVDGQGRQVYEYVPSGCMFRRRDDGAEPRDYIVGAELWTVDLLAAGAGELPASQLFGQRCRQWNAAPDRLRTWPSDLLLRALPLHMGG